ncbi:glycosyltransferase [Brevibacterium moorei]|uniref:glycosyltransferase n=1 Tax=Brevibacterium moorei TaxID=2968457 RepID=UPI00211C826D|nr:glycosyltransferase [Brevibacterium sp. 68QC2CO]MCQ9385129.1 glycosyltransferase [Brevibacterium sp. 68QC2CO]
MAQVIVDGKTYVPADENTGRIGIGITTRNRPELLKRLLDQVISSAPADARIVVVDDSSTKPAVVPGRVNTLIRYSDNVGVAQAKNKCIEELMRDKGVAHLFLLDDDAIIKDGGVWDAYVAAPEPHYAYSSGLIEVHRQDGLRAWNLSGGVFLYYRRDVIEDVGGMDPKYGLYGAEHVGLSDRIYNRGWTTARYQDITDGDKYVSGEDYTNRNHKTAASPAAVKYNQDAGRPLWIASRDDAYSLEYRSDSDVVITTLLTKHPDPQRGSAMRASTSELSDLALSIKAGDLVVLHDDLSNPSLKTGNNHDVQFIKVDSSVGNPYFARWLHIWQYLRDHPEWARVWCVDGTDVRQLRNPFQALKTSTIYVGWEPQVYGSVPWFAKNHKGADAKKFLTDHESDQVVNAGLVGGDYKTVLEFANAMWRRYLDREQFRHDGWTDGIHGVGDMLDFGAVVYEQFGDRFRTGTEVATIFKAEERDNGASFWAHK